MTDPEQVATRDSAPAATRDSASVRLMALATAVRTGTGPAMAAVPGLLMAPGLVTQMALATARATPRVLATGRARVRLRATARPRRLRSFRRNPAQSLKQT